MRARLEGWGAIHYFGASLIAHSMLIGMLNLTFIFGDTEMEMLPSTMEVEMVVVPPKDIAVQEAGVQDPGGGSTSSSQAVPALTPSQPKSLFSSAKLDSSPSATASNTAPQAADSDSYKVSGTNQSSKGSLASGTGIGSSGGSSGGSGSGQGTGTSGNGSGSGSGGSSGGGSNIDWQGRFLTRVEQNKTYPFQARRQGVEGVVRVRVVISPGGSLEANHVSSSSGDSRLDKAATDAVRASAPFPHDKGENLVMTIPIRFVMQ